MYANQVLESLQSIRKDASTSHYAKVVDGLKSDIEQSIKFHFGRLTDALSPLKQLLLNEKKPFGACPEYIRLPYNMCWFDYYYDKKVAPGSTKRPAPRRGMLIEESIIPKIFIVQLFYQFEGDTYWTMRDCRYLLPAGEKFSDVATTGDFIKLCGGDPIRFTGMGIDFHRLLDLWCFPVDLTNEYSKDRFEEVIHEDHEDLIAFNVFCLLLNARNVYCEEVVAPELLNKKRTRKGIAPIFTYKILKVDTSKYLKSNNHFNGESHNRIHFCRGHFKEYTKEKPLFGMHTGLFWWEPHVRGRNRKGIVMKEYEVG